MATRMIASRRREDGIVPPIRFGNGKIMVPHPSSCVVRPARLPGALAFVLALTGVGHAAPFEFAPAPQTDLNRIYKVDKATGEVGACQFQLKEGGVGVTVCFPAGEGAGPQAPSDYTLVPSRHEREGGIFRVNIRTGEMSICYVFDDKVVCTPQSK
jgi:hypothetical protein